MSLIHIETTQYGGRGFFASTDIAEDTLLLECVTPLSFSIFRAYKKDACAYCFACDFYRSCKVKLEILQQYSLVQNFNKELTDPFPLPSPQKSQTYAGLFFCSEKCRHNWTAMEDPTGLISLILDTVDRAVQSTKKLSPEASTESTAPAPEASQINESYIQQQWDLAVDPVITTADLEHASNLLESLNSSRVSSSSSSSSTTTGITTPSTPVTLETPLTPLSINTTPKRPRRKKKPQNPILTSEQHDTARFISVLLTKMFLNTRRPITDAADDGMEHFENLQSNELLHLRTFPDVLQSQIRVYQFLQNVLPHQVLPYLTSQLFRDTLGREAANAFGIWQLPITPESELLGSSLYPHASFFNHSCGHNVKKVRKGRSILFVTQKPVQAGEQLYINYGMYSDMPYKERQEKLKEQWFFDCKCNRCAENN